MRDGQESKKKGKIRRSKTLQEKLLGLIERLSQSYSIELLLWRFFPSLLLGVFEKNIGQGQEQEAQAEKLRHFSLVV